MGLGSVPARSTLSDALNQRDWRIYHDLAMRLIIRARRGAGPLVRGSTARVRDRLILLGDAAGSIDPLSGEGVSLGLAGALDLAALLPEAIAAGAGGQALLGWERAWRRRQRAAVAWTALLLGLARRPALRRGLLSAAAAVPRPIERLVALAIG